MIRLDMEQGSPEWVAARLGIPTASQFHRLITPAKLTASRQADAYMHELLCEHVLGEPMDGASSAFMERGTELEVEARSFYEFERGVDVETVGFCLRDDHLAGCSPDGLVDDEGLVEIKCLGAAKHLAGVLQAEPPTDYRLQLQGQLLVTGRAWVDLLLYSPALPSRIFRVERHHVALQALSEALMTFHAHLSTAKERLRDLGCHGWEERLEAEVAAREASDAAFMEKLVG